MLLNDLEKACQKTKMAEIKLAVVLSSTCFEQQSVEFFSDY